jgi:hypothetical protein
MKTELTDEQIQEMILRHAEGARAMSEEDMARRQLEMIKGRYNAWPSDHAKGQADMSNELKKIVLGDTPTQQQPPKTKVLSRLKRWLGFN